MSDYDERVASGARFLDEKCKGWVKDIDLNCLDLQNTNWCVCGQIERNDENSNTDSNFYKFLFRKDVSREQANRLGFWLYSTESEREYSKLTNAWKRLIRKRRQEDEHD